MFFVKITGCSEARDFMTFLVEMINNNHGSTGQAQNICIEDLEGYAKTFIRNHHFGEIDSEMINHLVEGLLDVGARTMGRWSSAEIETMIRSAAPDPDEGNSLTSNHHIQWIDRILEDPRLPNYLLLPKTVEALYHVAEKSILDSILAGIISRDTY